MASSIVVIAGPTGSGKSALAMELALLLGGEIVNADSQQVYRGLDVGTAKPGPEDRERIPHHLLDIASPSEQLTAARFVALADQAVEGIRRRGGVPLVVGGSGLWLRALLRGLVEAPKRDEAIRSRLENEALLGDAKLLHRKLLAVDPEAAARLHPNDKVRIIRALEVHELTGKPLSAHIAEQPFGAPRYRHRLLALLPERDLMRARIAARTASMLKSGWLEETRAVLETGLFRERLGKVLGYEEVAAHLEGALSLEEAEARVALRTFRYAKRQLVWLRREPEVEWVRPPVDAGLVARDLKDWLSVA